MRNDMIRFSRKQRQVLTWWRQNRWQAIICDGAVRSGKTFCMGLSFFLWAQSCFDGRQFALCGKTVGALRRNLLTELVPCLRRIGMIVRENRSANSLTVEFGGQRNQFLLFGGKDESSAALIQGSTLAGLLLDEAALMPRSFVEQAVARCSVPGQQAVVQLQPGGAGALVLQGVDSRRRRAGGRCGCTLPWRIIPACRRRSGSGMSGCIQGVFYRRFVLGEWAAAQGLVYDFFDPARDAAPVPEGPSSRWRVSVRLRDGESAVHGAVGVNGTAFGTGWRRSITIPAGRDGRKPTRSTRMLLERLAAGREIQRVIVDPSAASFIETLRQRGWRVKKANNDVADGIRVTADLLRQRRIVLCDTCRDCLREMALYCWDEKAGKDAAEKEHDHAMDEMRYFAMDLVGERSGGFAVTSVRRQA